MEEKIFIVTRQNFYSSRGAHHAMAEDCPIVGAWRRRKTIDEFFKRRLLEFIENGCIYEHVNECNSVGLLERYIIKDSDGNVVVSYSVILEPVI